MLRDAPLFEPLEMHFSYAPERSGPWRVRFAEVAGRHRELPLAMRREKYLHGGSTGEHVHLDFLALYAVRGGSGAHSINGAPYGLSRGDVYIMPTGAAHEYRDYKALEIDAFYFSPELFCDAEIEALRAHPGFWPLFAGEPSSGTGAPEPRLHLAPEPWREVESEIEELRGEWRRASSSASLLLRAGLFRLLVHLARRFEEEPRRTSTHAVGAQDFSMAQAVRFCEEHFAQELSVPFLASRMFLSPSHFSERFAREVGMPPGAYIRRLRLERARVLLREGNLSVTQAALESGFGDAAHFSRAFRAAYGVAPSRYKRQREK